MTNTLDRLIEEGLAFLIDSKSTGIQCVPHLLAGGELEAQLPRVTIMCSSQESPDFQEVIPDGIYDVYPVETLISSIAEATGPTSSMEMQEMNSAVDDVMIYDGNLARALTAGLLKVYGVIPGGCRQEMAGNRIIRYRSSTIWARLQPITAAPIGTEEGIPIGTEEGAPIYTE